MSSFIAALPMYDWPEARAEVDAEWERLRAAFRAAGIDAPARLARRNADLPAVPGGIRDAAGTVIAPDPATLRPDDLDFPTLWKHPNLLVAQTCWGPMELGLARYVTVVGQPDYSAFEGGHGADYSSALLTRRGEATAPPRADGHASIPVDRLRGRRFAYNGADSMSGFIALRRDLEAMGESADDLFASHTMTGAHRASIVAVASGTADICAVDCRSWALARRFEAASRDLVVVGWTARRPGLPYVVPKALPGDIAATVRTLLAT